MDKTTGPKPADVKRENYFLNKNNPPSKALKRKNCAAEVPLKRIRPDLSGDGEGERHYSRLLHSILEAGVVPPQVALRIRVQLSGPLALVEQN